MQWRNKVLETADRVGLGSHARRARLAVAPYHWRRDDLTHRHLRMLLAFTLDRRDSVFVDVGAHQGRVLHEALRISPDGRHIAIEPIPKFAAELRRRFPAAEVHEVALSDRNGEARFTYVPELPGYSGLREQDYPKKVHPVALTVRTVRLDDLLGATAPTVIKIDVEGAEREVLEGGMNAIVTHRPTIVFEHHRASGGYGTRSSDLWELLVEEAGLRVFDIDGGGPYSLDRMEHEYERGRIWDFVAKP